MPVAQGLGEALQALRERQGLSQRQAADRASTTQSMVSRYERGVSNPEFSTVEKLIRGMGYTLGDLEDALSEVRGEAPRNHHASQARPWDTDVDAALRDQRIEWEVDRRLARILAEMDRARRTQTEEDQSDAT